MAASANQFAATATYKYTFQINTSLPVNEQPADIQLSLACHWNRYLPDLDNVQFSRTEHDTILSRCFKYGTSWLLGLVPEIFLHDMLYSLTSASPEPHSTPEARLQHYTPMLHCAIMAFASAFSDNPIIRSCATREKFATHAKQWLNEEITQPVMCLVRSLALLAEYHCALGQKETGYMYMGMSIRAARAMVSVGQRAQWVSQGIAGYPESTMREWHFWSIFAQDKVMSLDFGRTPGMPIPHAGINLPLVEPELDSQSWSMNPTDTIAVSKDQPKLTTLAFFESCKLLVIATRMLKATLSPERNLQGNAATLNLHLQLDTWFNNLPEGLLIWAHSVSPLPHVIILHICYWWLLIYLHQPFYHIQSSDGSPPAMNLSLQMCDRGAHKIVQLLTIFDEQHGLRFFPRNMLQAISSCGDALLSESASSPPEAAQKRATAHEGVGVCVRALRTVSITWPCAEAFANELEARLEEQRPRSSLEPELEMDESSEDTATVIMHDQIPDAPA
ncbi:hypothetical protein FS749_007012 [Ceratobasidium sp. UAMH 11750]|nr:hypothetical protein FS749_007012 [Ceratobasidium sp. UAMH 11750]